MDNTKELNPCPFCGAGESRIDPKGVIWLGMRYSEPSSYDLLHWCEKKEGVPSSLLKITGSTEQQAIELWNTRAKPTFEPNQCREAFEELKNLCEAILLHDDGSLSETNKFWRRQGYETVLQFIKTKEVMPNTRPEPTEEDMKLATEAIAAELANATGRDKRTGEAMVISFADKTCEKLAKAALNAYINGR